MNNWCRLWHDMPTDPKWRVISKKSGQSIPEVLSVYLVLMADASANETERGRTQINYEDISATLDMEETSVIAITDAMQGRVLDGNMLTGWSKRNPKREDGSAGRSRAWREARKAEDENQTTPNDTERNQTLDKIREDKEEEKKEKLKQKEKKPDGYELEFDEIWNLYPQREGTNTKSEALRNFRARRKEGHSFESLRDAVKRYATYCQIKGNIGTSYVMQASSFFGPQKRGFEANWSVSGSGKKQPSAMIGGSGAQLPSGILQIARRVLDNVVSLKDLDEQTKARVTPYRLAQFRYQNWRSGQSEKPTDEDFALLVEVGEIQPGKIHSGEGLLLQ